MKKTVKSILLCIPAVMCLLISAGSTMGDADTVKKTLVYSSPGNVGPLNPHLYSPNQMFGQAMVYEPLVRYMGAGRIVPWLARSWEMSPDGKAWTFHLREDVSFTDGIPFTSLAVKKNLEAILKNGKRHEWLELVTLIEEVQAVDAYTVRILLKQPYYPILQDLSLIRPFRFLSPAAFPESGNTADGIKAPVGTGPWKLVKIKLGEYDIFERNNDYWGEKPHVDVIEVRVISDANTCAMAFETGEVDLIYGEDQISLDTLDRFRKDPRHTARISSPLAFRSIAINSNKGPTRMLAVRKAILHAVDKDAMVKGIFLGTTERADTILPESIPYCGLNLEPYDYDLEKAAALLENAGWKIAGDDPFRHRNGEVLALDFCFVGNSVIEKSIAEVMQFQFKKIGIRLNLKGVEVDLFKKMQMTGEFNLIFNDTWGAPYEPHAYCGSMRVPSHGDYHAQAGLPMKTEIDRAITLALSTLDETRRRDAYRYVLTTLHEQAVYLPICSINLIMVHNKNLSDVAFGTTHYEIPFERIIKQ